MTDVNIVNIVTIGKVVDVRAIAHRRLTCLLIMLLFLGACQAFAYDVLCHNGNTAFEAQFHTGISVKIGPPNQGELAVRRCRASLNWENHDLVVENGSAEIDLDVFGAEVGFGQPVAAFQVKQTESECCMRYLIYSLQKPPQLLRTIVGGSHFSAADSNLDNRVEIWTDDAAAVDGFEGLRASQLQFPPVCVLRFEDGRLLDVSSEFESYFDEEIAKLRGEIDPQELQRFKLTTANIATNRATSAKQGAGTQPSFAMKTSVLELVWAYLYSGREKQAWQTLSEMWPPRDAERIRSKIEERRRRGIRAQVDGVSHALSPVDVQRSKIYESSENPARPIMVRFYPSGGSDRMRGKIRVNLVVDSVGKVWWVKVSSRDKVVRNSVQRSAANWKFIPASVDEHPVASRVRIAVSLEQ